MIAATQSSNGSPLRKVMTPAEIQQASSGTSVPPRKAQAPQRGEAVMLTIAFFLVLVLVIRLVIRRQPAQNATPAPMSDVVRMTHGQ
jgi:hypothetical protein